VVGVFEVRKAFFMNINTLLLVYLIFAVIAVGVAIVIFAGNKSAKK
jgi:hypothetical protein